MCYTVGRKEDNMPKTLPDRINNTPFKIIVIGGAGSGKTTLGSTAKGSQYWFCFEDGLTSLLGKKHLYDRLHYDTYLPTVIAEDADKAWQAAEDQLEKLATGVEKYDSIIVDSISTATEVKFQSAQKHANTFGKKPKGFDEYGEMLRDMQKFVQGLMALPCNVILLAHEEKLSDENGRMNWNVLSVGQKFGPWLPKQVDDLWRMSTKQEKDGQKHILTTQGGRGFQAKSRMTEVAKFKPEEEPNLEKLMDKFYNNLAKL